jgi:hypothetical protein
MTRRASVVLAALCAAALPPAAAHAAPLDFTVPTYVDQQLGGGEPLVYADPVHHTLVYSSHEGTTHIYRPGLASQTTFTFAGGYRNQVNIWTSKDNGLSWQRSNFMGTGFTQDPTQNSGFSDPDLSQDDGGRIYNTGINLATNALFSSADGGVTWDRGTAQCHPGDRPWVVGAKKDEVFFATNTLEDVISQRVFVSTDGGRTCSQNGIPAFGRDWAGNGKMYYDRSRDSLVVPANQDGGGLGVATWKRGDQAFTFHKAANVDIYAHWAAIILDDAGGLYLTYDDDPRARGTSGGCGGDPTPVANTINYVYSPDLGKTWNPPVTVARPTGRRVFWPWLAAGDKGRINIAWYETDKVVDLACQNADISVKTATVTGAHTDNPTFTTTDPIGRPISQNSNICQSGTTCVATGEDRRLGDFFTNAINEQGCVMIATGDTHSLDPVTGGQRPISLPLFSRQISGPPLRGGGDCSGREANLGLPGVGSTNIVTVGGGVVGASNASGTSRSGKLPPCFSRRRFRIRLRAPKGDRLTSATIYVNAKKRRTLRGKALRRSRVDLLGLPKGQFTVTIQARTKKGKKLRQVRRYRTCVPRKRLPG